MFFLKILIYIVFFGFVVEMTNLIVEVFFYVFDGIFGLLDYSCVFMCIVYL